MEIVLHLLGSGVVGGVFWGGGGGRADPLAVAVSKRISMCAPAKLCACMRAHPHVCALGAEIRKFVKETLVPNLHFGADEAKHGADDAKYLPVFRRCFDAQVGLPGWSRRPYES